MIENGFLIQVKNKTKTLTPILALAIIMLGSTMLPLQTLHVNITKNATTGQVSGSIIAAVTRPGFGGSYNLLVKGNTVPISYNIIGGALVGMLADPVRHSIGLAVNPGPSGGAIEIQLPRNTIDSKDAAGKDIPYVVKMDGTRISGEPTGICIGTCPNINNTFKESQNTGSDRFLTIIFGPESRFIEIVGDTGMA
jgi:hypothetical protein